VKNSLFLLFALFIFSCKTEVAPPEAFGPLPSPQQLSWQEMEMNMFVHFNMNTFTDMEWGLGGEPPTSFNPTNLDTRQWAQIAKAAGMKGIILTAKHHDGFCLWPSAYTEHSVKNSPWKNGQGDVIKELSEACKEDGLKMGLYLSPWDRNHADYGTPAYITYFRNQMTELLTQYGDLFEFWIDGANGGTGYYGGANEERRIDRETYYDWDSTFKLAFQYQPEVIIFSDSGPGCRWVGNEQGYAKETNWSFLNTDNMAPGIADSKILQQGMEEGDKWIPAEADVSIRPGWYYHASQDDKVKSLDKMLEIYYNSVGRNALLLLNFPVDTTGQIHPADSARVMEMANQIKKDFEDNLIDQARLTASNTRGESDQFSVENIRTDNEKYWTIDEGLDSASIELAFDKPVTISRVLLQEEISLGQRVKSFTIKYKKDGQWQVLDKQTTIGYKRILRFPEISTDAIQIVFEAYRAIPVISRVGVY